MGQFIGAVVQLGIGQFPLRERNGNFARNAGGLSLEKGGKGGIGGVRGGGIVPGDQDTLFLGRRKQGEGLQGLVRRDQHSGQEAVEMGRQMFPGLRCEQVGGIGSVQRQGLVCLLDAQAEIKRAETCVNGAQAPGQVVASPGGSSGSPFVCHLKEGRVA